MGCNEQKSVNQSNDVTNDETQKTIITKNNLFTAFFNFLFKKKPWVGSIIVFLITIVANAISFYSGSNISAFSLFIITISVTIIVFLCLSPVLIMHLVKNLRRFIIDNEIEAKNIELSKELNKLTNNLLTSTEKLDKSIVQNNNYFEKIIIPHIDDCSRINNLVKKSYMIKNITDYYKHLTVARKNANDKDVYLTSFSTRPYEIDNKERKDYYLNDFKFIEDKNCQVYRIVTVHSSEKLSFLKKLIDDARTNKSAKYHLAYLDIEEFSDETGDKLPGIVGMQIIGDGVTLMDFRYARALRKDDFKETLYIESAEIANQFRYYYKDIWSDINISNDKNNISASNPKYKGYILYNGIHQSVHKNMESILKEIKSKIPVRNR